MSHANGIEKFTSKTKKTQYTVVNVNWWRESILEFNIYVKWDALTLERVTVSLGSAPCLPLPHLISYVVNEFN